MAIWIHQRPEEKCNEHEFLVAQRLRRLPDPWVIRWGFFYRDGRITREGDFLILAPDGRLAVLEVKKRLRHNARTGFSEGDGDDPVNQVLAALHGVIRALRSGARRNSSGGKPPFAFALLAGCENRPTDPCPHGLDPLQFLMGLEVLDGLEERWSRLVRQINLPVTPDEGHARRIFLEVFGENVGGPASARYLADSDTMIQRRITADYALLDALEENPRLLFRGGAGTGKTWLALEQARRNAEAGHHVLFLCYNKDFGAWLRRHLDRLKLPPGCRGRIRFFIWEDLAKWLLARIRGAVDLPGEDRDGKERYYSEILPRLMFDAVTQSDFEPAFDALVVDEGQDHDTRSGAGVGWWEIYLNLLKNGPRSPVAVFFDPAQRASFRNLHGCGFDEKDLHALLPDATRVRLRGTTRYTRRLAAFLRTLDSPATAELVASISIDSPVEGEDPVVETLPDFPAAVARANAQLKIWMKDYGVKPKDILVLCRQHPLETAGHPLGEQPVLGGRRLIGAGANPSGGGPPGLHCSSFNKSKGLDAQAVLLLQTAPFEAIDGDDYQKAFWLAASRARQLLAVFANQDGAAVRRESEAIPAARACAGPRRGGRVATDR